MQNSILLIDSIGRMCLWWSSISSKRLHFFFFFFCFRWDKGTQWKEWQQMTKATPLPSALYVPFPTVHAIGASISLGPQGLSAHCPSENPLHSSSYSPGIMMTATGLSCFWTSTGRNYDSTFQGPKNSPERNIHRVVRQVGWGRWMQNWRFSATNYSSSPNWSHFTLKLAF